MAEIYNDRLTQEETNSFMARNLTVGVIFKDSDKYYIITKTTANCVYYKPVNIIIHRNSGITQYSSIKTTEQLDPEQNNTYVKGQIRKNKSKIGYWQLFHGIDRNDRNARKIIELGDVFHATSYFN